MTDFAIRLTRAFPQGCIVGTSFYGEPPHRSLSQNLHFEMVGREGKFAPALSHTDKPGTLGTLRNINFQLG